MDHPSADHQGPHGGPLWHITLSVTGPAVELNEVRQALDRLSDERPFLLAGRYSRERAELRYWEEAPDMIAAGQFAVQLWEDHRESARLPAWTPTGLEILDRDLYHQRFAHGWGTGTTDRAHDFHHF